MSDQTVPDTAAASCTGAGSRQTLWMIATSHTGRPAGLPLNSARSVSLGRRASISPPPSTIATLLTGDAATAAAATLTRTAIVDAAEAPAAITALLLQLNAVSPGAPLQTQPAPTGTAVNARPRGRRSLTV